MIDIIVHKANVLNCCTGSVDQEFFKNLGYKVVMAKENPGNLRNVGFN